MTRTEAKNGELATEIENVVPTAAGETRRGQPMRLFFDERVLDINGRLARIVDYETDADMDVHELIQLNPGPAIDFVDSSTVDVYDDYSGEDVTVTIVTGDD